MSYTDLPPRSRLRTLQRPTSEANGSSSSSSSYRSRRVQSPSIQPSYNGRGVGEDLRLPRNQRNQSASSSDNSGTQQGSLDSNATLNEETSPSHDAQKGNTNNVYSSYDNSGFKDPSMHRAGDFSEPDSDQSSEQECNLGDREDKHKGMFANLLDLYGIDHQEEQDQLRQQNNAPPEERPWHLRRADSLASDYSQGLDPDDPLVTGEGKLLLDDADDLEKACLRQMSYKARRKHRDRIRIEFNITCKNTRLLLLILALTCSVAVLNRQTFLMRLAKSLLTFGAPSHRIESQLLSAARILEVDAEFIHFPGVIICSFGDPDTKTSETHFIKCSGRLSLGSLHEVHQIYRAVVHDEISAKKATARLEALLTAPPLYGGFTRCILSFFLAALICPLAFGGSFLDMWIAGLGAICLSLLQINFASKSQLYANVFEYVRCSRSVMRGTPTLHTGSRSRSSYLSSHED